MKDYDHKLLSVKVAFGLLHTKKIATPHSIAINTARKRIMPCEI